MKLGALILKVPAVEYFAAVALVALAGAAWVTAHRGEMAMPLQPAQAIAAPTCATSACEDDEVSPRLRSTVDDGVQGRVWPAPRTSVL